MVTFRIVPYAEINGLSGIGRIRKLLNLAKERNIVLLEGRLAQSEEAELIKVTMEEINKDFRGIELAVIDTKRGEGSFKESVASWMLGNRTGFTLIGPASIVKSIKKNPNKIEVLMRSSRK